MKYFLQIVMAVVIMMVFSCDEEKKPTEVTGLNSVIGKLTLLNQPIPQAEVQIDQVLNWKTTTDDNGDFEIKKVLEGFHTFTSYKELNDGRTLFMETEIIVNEEITDLGEIKLSDAPVLYKVDTSLVTISTVPLFWSKTQDNGFIEYKLYRDENADINESNGELLFTSSSAYDTTFVDTTYVAGFDYYYRVYSFFEPGKTGGSNVEYVRTPAKPLLLNGNFEEFTGDSIHYWLILHWWDGMYLIDSTTVFEGKYSVEALHDPTLPYYDQRMVQSIPASNFISNQNYKLSIQMKARENAYVGVQGWLVGQGYVDLLFQFNLGGGSFGTNWELHSSELFTISDQNAKVWIYLGVGGDPPPGEQFAIGWFDDAKIELVR